jgi:hypothetical protein
MEQNRFIDDEILGDDEDNQRKPKNFNGYFLLVENKVKT